ncbi:hypothetical protein Pcinc_029104 [Petrolisthes cinctipes]|uniref:Uncharacterized protein n=1 Tax=Petrolisthes cinctipes TaxID=88211 RepID=A0AAE1K8C3_PETCI|nr:hypothetical protein Pcinc_029104 [Petrolisthes cinctipes]
MGNRVATLETAPSPHLTSPIPDANPTPPHQQLTDRVVHLEKLLTTFQHNLNYVNHAAHVTPSVRLLHLEQRIFALEEILSATRRNDGQQKPNGNESPERISPNPSNLDHSAAVPTPRIPKRDTMLLIGDVNLTNIYSEMGPTISHHTTYYHLPPLAHGVAWPTTPHHTTGHPPSPHPLPPTNTLIEK